MYKVGPYQLEVGAYNSIYRGEITPVKPIYFRPFTRVSYNL